MNDLLNFYIISNDFYICLLKVMYIGSKRTESPGYYCFYKSGECKLKIVHVVAQITCNTIKHTIISKNFIMKVSSHVNIPVFTQKPSNHL